MISYAVSQRATGFGIRVAIGAQAADVRSMVVRQGLTLASAGVAVGLVGATAATTALRALLFEVSPRDPVTFGAVGLVAIAVSVAASYLPAPCNQGESARCAALVASQPRFIHSRARKRRS